MVALESAELFRNLKAEDLAGLRQVTVERTSLEIITEIADNLFQAFATHGKAHGTGLGLSICKKNHRRPRLADLGEERTGVRGGVFLRAAVAEVRT
jgi:hypothetical protein